MRKVITTVGTSIFTNFNRDSDAIQEDYDNLKDSPHRAWDEENERIHSICNNDDFKKWITRHFGTCCAEISSLLKILETEDDDLEVYLLATDTILSRLAAKMIQQQTIMHPHGKKIILKFNPNDGDVIQGLQVNNANTFETDGLQNFIKRFVTIQKFCTENDKLILNITGGYKGLIPYLTLIGQINEVSIKYLFEESKELITIPQLPINFDWEIAVEYSYQLKKDLTLLSEEEKKELFENGILDDSIRLTPLGKLFKLFADTYDLEKPIVAQLRGDCAEFRWFEYFVSKYPNYKLRRSVGNGQAIRGISIQKEIDVLIEKDAEIIIAESKPIKDFYEEVMRSKSVKEQVNDLLSELRDKKIVPNEYCLCLYTVKSVDIKNLKLNISILDVKNLVLSIFPNCKFTLYLMRKMGELQGFMKKPLKSVQDSIQIINL